MLVSDRLVRVTIGSESLRFVFICTSKYVQRYLNLCSASPSFNLTRNVANPMYVFKVLLKNVYLRLTLNLIYRNLNALF